jgi:hypothetical protein
MKTRLKSFLKIPACLALLALTPFGTTAEKAADYRYVRVHSVQMEDRAALMKVQETWHAFVKKEVPDFHKYVFRTDDTGRASWVNFANELSDFEKQEKQFQAALQKYGSLKFPDVGVQWLQAFRSSDLTISELDSTLSYQHDPSAPLHPFVKITVLHLKRDQEQDAIDALKQLNDLDHAAGIKTPRIVFWRRYGSDTPVMALVTPAKDIAEYYTGYAKRTELRHAKGKEIIEKLIGCARKIENQHVTIHRELSHEPVARVAAK